MLKHENNIVGDMRYATAMQDARALCNCTRRHDLVLVFHTCSVSRTMYVYVWDFKNRKLTHNQKGRITIRLEPIMKENIVTRVH